MASKALDVDPLPPNSASAHSAHPSTPTQSSSTSSTYHTANSTPSSSSSSPRPIPQSRQMSVLTGLSSPPPPSSPALNSIKWRRPGFGSSGEHQGKIVLCAAGLPARGKTHCSRSLHRYLTWLGIQCRVFSLSDHRRKILGSGAQLPQDYFFFEGRSPTTDALRKRVADSLEDEVEAYLMHGGGQVAIYDANNQTVKARTAIRRRFEPSGIQTMFIESQCDRDDIIERNIRSVKLSSPDYLNMDPNLAVSDYWQRIRDHERHYEPIEQPSFPYVKLINVGETVVVNNIQGYLQSKVVFFLMNLHNRRRTIWIARSGHSTIEHSYVADTDLSELGVEYAQNLRECILKRRQQVIEHRKEVDPTAAENPLHIWVSSRRRCISTGKPLQSLGYRIFEKNQMTEINPGAIDGMSLEEIRAAYPDEVARSHTDPYRHRYPRGESYHDLSVRLEPVIHELERESADMLVIAHASVIRCLLAYLQGRAAQDIPFLDPKRGDLIEINPTSYGVTTELITFWRAPEEKRESERGFGDAFHATSSVVPK